MGVAIDETGQSGRPGEIDLFGSRQSSPNRTQAANSDNPATFYGNGFCRAATSNPRMDRPAG
jgi:hypothetical protein